MIEEMPDGLEGKVFELSMALQSTEHDLSHVVIERDRAQERVDRVRSIVAEYFGPSDNWHRPMDGPSVMRRIQQAVI